MRWSLALALLLPFTCSVARGAAPAAPPLLVHVNQVALERTGPKAAIVEYSGAATAGKFAVLKDGVAIQTGQLAALPAFTEWRSGARHFKADFSTLTTSGKYELQATIGDATARSASFAVADNALFVTTASAVLDYFRHNRHTKEADKHIRIFATQRYANVWGGWKDAGGDNGKYLSHLSYANFFNPQQTAMVVWALGASYDRAPALYRAAGLETRVVEEAIWGADYLHRLLDDEGYFYMTVFDRWATPGAERMVTGYVGIDGVYTKDYRAAFREGAGVAIAALARASRLSTARDVHGEFTAAQYLQDAEKAFAHLLRNGPKYCDDGVENIIDDYTALLAAVELYRATRKDAYLEAARLRADNLNGRLTPAGWFRSDASARPYYHAAEAGFPIVSLVEYLDVEKDQARAQHARHTIRTALDYQLTLDARVANPYNYARQSFRIYKSGKLDEKLQEGFFIPHANETGYWWQGESARLASLATAAILGGRVVADSPRQSFGVGPRLAEFAQNQLDWTLGRNPFDMSLLYGFGARNPPSAVSAGEMVKGGISNGITGAPASDEGRGIVFAPGPDDNNWRWLEQWLPHSTWFLLAVTAMTDAPRPAASTSTAAASSNQLLFDDFSYDSVDAFQRNGWIARTAVGWPGIAGATWDGAISFIDDASAQGNRLVRMTAQTDGTKTRQAQFCHQRKYREGTYAARVRFRDAPVSGPDGDQVVETFYLIAPLKAPLDPDYSEQDFEYLPNGGWGGADLTLHTTTWETFRPEPEWLQVSASDARRGSLEGWHTLVLHVANDEVHYFLDGEPRALHGEPFYPEDTMSINFNLWFIREGLIDSRKVRVYQQDVDWVFHRVGDVLSPDDVAAEVARLRSAGVAFRDTVVAPQPALTSPCDF